MLFIRRGVVAYTRNVDVVIDVLRLDRNANKAGGSLCPSSGSCCSSPLPSSLPDC